MTTLIDMSFTHAGVDQQWLHETVAALRRETPVLINWPANFSQQLQLPEGVDDSNSGFEFMEYHPQGDFQLPANRQFRRLDADLFARCSWHDVVLGSFGTIENLFTNGLGICLMDGEEICSEAYAIYLGAGKFEIGIVTNEKYRRQGCGYLACRHLFKLLEERGYEPHWSYLGGNVGSPALAQKLGFRKPREYGWFHYPQIG
jgi:hypothetical protein